MFGENILSISPIDWVIENGAFSEGVMKLKAGGYATQALDQDDILSIPSELYLSVIADNYTNSQEPTAFIRIKAQSTTGSYFEYTVPLIDTGNGYCTVSFPSVQTSYVALSFTIESDEAVNITSWVLAGPVIDPSLVGGITQEIPRILDDYNTAPFTVAQEEVTIGFITAEILEKTDLNGHALISYISKIATTLTIRIKDNTVTELYTPILYNIVPGRNSIGIPHAYLKKFSGIHTFIITAQVDVGNILLFTRGMLYTIDGGYLAKRLMDIDTEITDMTLMQLPVDSEPSKVFAVGMEDGMARVRYRPIKGGTGAIWEPAYEVGPATTACIEFDGNWVERFGTAGYALITETMPWVAWIAPDKTLYAQHGLDVNTLIALATDVDNVSMVRGFKSFQVLENDQGIIIVYTKAGSVYYRNYCNQAGGVTLWELEQQIVEAGNDVTNVHIVRLNDYRVCLTTSAPSSNKIFITPRTYVGQAFKADNPQIVNAFVNAPIIQDVKRCHTINTENAIINNAAVSVEFGETLGATILPVALLITVSEDGKTIEATFDKAFWGIEDLQLDRVTVTPTNQLLSIQRLAPGWRPAGLMGRSADTEGTHTLTLTFASPVNVEAPIDLTFNGAINSGYVDTAAVWFGTRKWTISLTPPRPDHDEEAMIVDAIISHRFDAITYLTSYAGDEEAILTDAFVTTPEITLIGTDPI